MLKKEITYKGLDGEEVTETFYFHLNEAEIVEMQMSVRGGLEDHLKAVVASEDGKEIIAVFKDLILRAYGKRSEDGKRFIKTQELRDEFESTQAYSAFFMEMVTDADAAVEFVNGIIPQDVRERAGQQVLPQTQQPVQAVPQKLTPAEARDMDLDELQSGLATGKYVLAKEDELP